MLTESIGWLPDVELAVVEREGHHRPGARLPAVHSPRRRDARYRRHRGEAGDRARAAHGARAARDGDAAVDRARRRAARARSRRRASRRSCLNLLLNAADALAIAPGAPTWSRCALSTADGRARDRGARQRPRHEPRAAPPPVRAGPAAARTARHWASASRSPVSSRGCPAATSPSPARPAAGRCSGSSCRPPKRISPRARRCAPQPLTHRLVARARLFFERPSRC